MVDPEGHLQTKYDDAARPVSEAKSPLTTGWHSISGHIHGIPVRVSSFSLNNGPPNIVGYHANFGNSNSGVMTIPITQGQKFLDEIDIPPMSVMSDQHLESLQNLIQRRQDVIRRNLLRRTTQSLRRNIRPPEQFARAPAKTGAVVRGVFYAPGKMIPDIETETRDTLALYHTLFQQLIDLHSQENSYPLVLNVHAKQAAQNKLRDIVAAIQRKPPVGKTKR